MSEFGGTTNQHATEIFRWRQDEYNEIAKDESLRPLIHDCLSTVGAETAPGLRVILCISSQPRPPRNEPADFKERSDIVSTTIGRTCTSRHPGGEIKERASSWQRDAAHLFVRLRLQERKNRGGEGHTVEVQFLGKLFHKEEVSQFVHQAKLRAEVNGSKVEDLVSTSRQLSSDGHDQLSCGVLTALIRRYSASSPCGRLIAHCQPRLLSGWTGSERTQMDGKARLSTELASGGREVREHKWTAVQGCRPTYLQRSLVETSIAPRKVTEVHATLDARYEQVTPGTCPRCDTGGARTSRFVRQTGSPPAQVTPDPPITAPCRAPVTSAYLARCKPAHLGGQRLVMMSSRPCSDQAPIRTALRRVTLRQAWRLCMLHLTILAVTRETQPARRGGFTCERPGGGFVSANTPDYTIQRWECGIVWCNGRELGLIIKRSRLNYPMMSRRALSDQVTPGGLRCAAARFDVPGEAVTYGWAQRED
ncbi:hypothetical protein Bbelb_221670 [Branchiostoma belcheri]|nr:hypothetical protein Bbelb_221670 [Branchiostoma belcheri]